MNVVRPDLTLVLYYVTAVGLLALGWGFLAARARAGHPSRLYRRWAPRVSALRRYVRRAPLTFGYIAAFTATSLVAQNTPDKLSHVVAVYNSTTVWMLSKEPLQVLVSSAFIVDQDAAGYLLYVVAFAGPIALFESRIRSMGWLVVAAASHILASIGIAGLEILTQQNAAQPTLNTDVGISYVMCGLLGGFFLTAGRRARWILVLGGLPLFAAPFLLYHPAPVWAYGHPLATVIGLGLTAAILRFQRNHPLPPLEEETP